MYNYFVKSATSLIVLYKSNLKAAKTGEQVLKMTDIDGGIAVMEESRGWLGRWFQWSPTSMKILQDVEHKIMSCLKTPYVGRYVNIGSKVGRAENHIWTISMNEHSDNVPLVMIHGFGAGVAFWAMNLDVLASKRPVYAFDLLGFGRSSRPAFDCDAAGAEGQLVESIEDWRRAMGLGRFVLLGHSMGGFLAASYAIKYPERVQHLILADPWGFQGIKAIEQWNQKVPLFARIVVSLMRPFNPLAGLRAAGPCGPKLVTRLRSDLTKKFAGLIEDENAIPDYIYHCNAQTPSGESAFKAMTESLGWAKRPMIDRIDTLDADVPITFIYGARSWMENSPGYQTKNIRSQSKVYIHEIAGAGHHVYADQVEVFNCLVSRVCEGESGLRAGLSASLSEDEGIVISPTN